MQPNQNLGTFNGIGWLGNITSFTSSFDLFERMLSNIIGVLTIIAGLWFIFMLFSGAISWLGAGNDKQAVQSAQKKITNAAIGLLIVVLAYTLIGIIGTFLGLPILSPALFLFNLYP